ncbi:hypothetical protein KY285_023744 [Solanum tuberosum]|nr:hypothetical protein KY289_024078 [Solanum tuberosum]KAH0675943.1 hypothetical protein KY285_023744 [Solanum tuberosum]
MSTPMINNNPRITDSNQSQGRMTGKNKDSHQQMPSKAAEQGDHNSMSQVQGTHDHSKGDNSSKFSFGIQGNQNMRTPDLIRQNKEGKQKDNNAQHQEADHHQQRHVIPSGNFDNHNTTQVANIKNNAQLQIHANEQNRSLENQKLQDTVHNSKDHQEHGKQDKGQGNNANHKFPKISSNFEKQSHPPNRNKIGDQNTSGPTVNNPQSSQNHSRKEQIPEPAPFTVIQTFAAKVKQNRNQKVDSLNLEAHEFTTRQGLQL